MEVGPKIDTAEKFIPIESLDNQQVRNYLFKVWTDKLPIQSFRKGSSHENEKIYSFGVTPSFNCASAFLKAVSL